MKETLLRKLWIVMLAVLLSAMAGNLNVSAAEISSELAETESLEEEEETADPEEPDLPVEEEEITEREEQDLSEEEEEITEPEEQNLSEEEEEITEQEVSNLSEEEEEFTEPEEEETGLQTVEEEQLNPVRGTAALQENDTEEQTTEEMAFDRIHYIRLKDHFAASDSILIESNGHYGLADASHPSSDPDPAISNFSVDVDDVISYLRTVGVLHLDFVLGTHSHSDHIGGMKFLASALNTEGNYWVDSDTVYFYKQYYYNEVEEEELGWNNARMFRQSVEAMTERGVVLVETSTHDEEALQRANAVFVKGGDDPVSDSIAFSLGDFAISLFNLYHNSSENENLNSIVTAVSKDDRTTLLMGDLEMEDGYERRVSNAAVEKYGNADVIKLGHHGYEECTSRDMLLTLEPSYLVTTSNRTGCFYDDEPPYNSFLSIHGITIYRAAESLLALVEDLSGEGICFCTYDSSGELTKEPVEWKARMTPGWKKWNRDNDTYDYIYIFADGSAATGWNQLTRNGKTSWYLFGQDGINLRGFQIVGQYIYYLNAKGEMQRGWQTVNGKRYYFDGYGIMQTGWQQVDGKWYYMDSSGAMQTGWLKVNDKRYYLDNNGVMQKSKWVYGEGKWAYVNGYGEAQIGWQQIGGKWYYMDSEGFMQTGWLKVNGKRYYLDNNGVMQKSKWVYGEGKWAYVNGYGEAQTGWQQIDGKWYYMDIEGFRQTGWLKVNGKRYYLDNNGVMQKSKWVYGEGKWAYVNGYGEAQTGWQKIGGKWYYMDSEGFMQTGWQQIESNWYYLGSDGAMVINSFIVKDGIQRYVNGYGIMQ